jgi:hypothetical protein
MPVRLLSSLSGSSWLFWFESRMMGVIWPEVQREVNEIYPGSQLHNQQLKPEHCAELVKSFFAVSHSVDLGGGRKHNLCNLSHSTSGATAIPI